MSRQSAPHGIDDLIAGTLGLPKKELWDYQVFHAYELVGQLLTDHVTILGGPMGCGKTIIVRYSVEILLSTGALRAALVVAPQHQIKASWSEGAVLTLPKKYDPTVWELGSGVTIRQDQWEEVSKPSYELAPWLAQKSPTPRTLVATHQGLLTAFDSARGGFFEKGLDGKFTDKKLDLTGRLLILDETHHVAVDNAMGRAVKAWEEQGGMLAYVSGTLFRQSGKIRLPDITPSFRSQAQHVMEGFAPELNFEFKNFSFKALSKESLAGDILPEGDLSKLAKEIVQWWDNAERPPFVLVVPRASKKTTMGSKKWAVMLKREFEKLPEAPRVFDAVGSSQDVKERLYRVLREERARASKGEERAWDIFLAGKRFDEGTDWPFCCAVGVIGLPRSLLRIMQLMGRGGRRKDNLVGIPPRYQRCSTMVFFMPASHVEKAWAAYERDHAEYVWSLSTAWVNYQTISKYLAEQRKTGTGLEVLRKRAGDKPKSALVWLAITSLLGWDIEKTHRVYTLLQQAVIAAKKRKPTKAELEQCLRVRLGCDDRQIADAFRAYQVRQLMGNPKELQQFAARVTRMVEGTKVSDRLIRQELQVSFDKATEDFSDLVDASRATQTLVATIKGQTAKQVERALREVLQIPDYTLPEVTDIVQRYFDQTGNVPDAATRDNLERYTGEPRVTFHLLNKHLIEKFDGMTLLRLTQDMGLGGWSGGPRNKHQMAFEKFHRQNPTILERFIEGALDHRAAGNTRCSIQQLDGKLRYADGGHPYVDSNITSYYVRVIISLVPALTGFFKTLSKADRVVDLKALGIDWADRRWDDYHIRAGGELPREMPRRLAGANSDSKKAPVTARAFTFRPDDIDIFEVFDA